MAELPSLSLGKFDMVLSLCSLYYLDDQEMYNLTKYISEISEIFIVQCNTNKNIDRDNPHTYEKASVEFLNNALKNNGFPITQIIAPPHYSRPIVIGRKS